MRSPMHSTVCAPASDNRCSKSNIRVRRLLKRRPSRSPVAVSAIEKSRDVLLDRIPQCGERARISDASQVLDACVSEVLIAVADFCWHVDILDVGWAPERREHGADQIAKARWPAGADIVD